MRTPHSSTNKGKRVKITMRNGIVHIDRFHDKKSGTIITLDPYGFIQKYHMKDIRAFSIYKPL